MVGRRRGGSPNDGRSTVRAYFQKWKSGGIDALKQRLLRGRVAKLTDAQKVELGKWLDENLCQKVAEIQRHVLYGFHFKFPFRAALNAGIFSEAKMPRKRDSLCIGYKNVSRFFYTIRNVQFFESPRIRLQKTEACAGQSGSRKAKRIRRAVPKTPEKRGSK
ncbi:MAG: helix-turn-helix domain-containing protein [Planctomycetia bacterium]|nr:helix-turn-helix domain-containing protein [Planctomycetia bacterium]